MSLRIGLLALALALAACGRTDHHEQPTAVAGRASAGGAGSSGAGGAGSTSSAGASTAAGSGGAAQYNCLFPVRGLEIEPSSDKPPQRYRLTEPYEIVAAPAHNELAAAYDVNGDAVSDLLLLDGQASPPRFRLLLTSRPPGVLDLVETDCAELRRLPAGRLLLRDLDGDGAQDFVVGTSDGVQAFLNRETGLLPALYHAPPTGRAQLINLGATDLNGDERADLIVGFDRVLSEAPLAFELGAQAFSQRDGGFDAGLAFTTTFEDGAMAEGTLYTGYLAAGSFRPGELGTALLVGHTPFSSSFRFVLQASFDGKPPVPLQAAFSQDTLQVFAVPRVDAHALLLAVSKTDFYLLDLASTDSASPALAVPSIVAQAALQFEGGPSHELGGGGENPRYFVFDIDRDGDLDFLERDPSTSQLALHVNFANQRFDDPQVFNLQVGTSAESPFIDLGPGSGIIGHPRPGQPDSAIYLFVADK